MDVIFTDLDGTLLDHETYSWEAARPALDRSEAARHPWILVTSKTRGRSRVLASMPGQRAPLHRRERRRRLCSGRLFSVCRSWKPNAGAPTKPSSGARRTRNSLPALQRASQTSQCRVRGFHEMTPEEVAETVQSAAGTGCSGEAEGVRRAVPGARPGSRRRARRRDRRAGPAVDSRRPLLAHSGSERQSAGGRG